MTTAFRFLLILGISCIATVEIKADELHLAARDGDISKIRLLISQGEAFNKRDQGGKTPEEIARMSGKKEAADFLGSIKEKKYPSGSIYIGQFDRIKEHGWGVYSTPQGSRYTGFFRDGKFHGMGLWVYANGSRYIGEFRDGSFHEAVKNDKLPFDVAVQRGYLPAVKAYLALGEDVNSANRAGQRPLHFAAFEGNAEIALLLIESGAIIEIEDDTKQRPIHYASYTGHESVIILLLEMGAEVNCKNKFGLTPLHYAVYHDSLNAAKVLLEHGASVYARDEYGMTPIKHAVKLGRPKVLKLLQQYKY